MEKTEKVRARILALLVGVIPFAMIVSTADGMSCFAVFTYLRDINMWLGMFGAFLLVICLPTKIYNRVTSKVSYNPIVFALVASFAIDTIGKIATGFAISLKPSQALFYSSILSFCSFRHSDIPARLFLMLIAFLPVSMIPLLFAKKMDASGKFALGLFIGGTLSEVLELLVMGHITDWLSVGGRIFMNVSDITQPYGIGVLMLSIIFSQFRRQRRN